MGMELASVSMHFPSTAAGTDDQWYVAWPFKGTWQPVAVVFTPATAVAASDTDNVVATLSVNDANPSTTFATVAAFDSSVATGAAFVLGTAVLPTVTKRKVSQGYTFKLATTHGGAGKIMDGNLEIVCEKVN